MRGEHTVYALVKNDLIIYVGCTSNLNSRICKHRSNKIIEFDYFITLKSGIEKKLAFSLERCFIETLLYLGTTDVKNKFHCLSIMEKIYKTDK